MNPLRPLLLLGLFVAAPALAALDIVRIKPDDEASAYVLKDTATGKVLGTFCDPATQKSDYGYSGDSGPGNFLWSEDRRYVAVNDPDTGRYRYVSLFEALDQTLKPIALPAFPPGSADALEAVRAASQLASEQTRAVRWQHNGTLLLSFFAATRETDDKPQVEASLWADVTFTGDTAAIASTAATEPAADSTVAETLIASLTSPAAAEKPAVEQDPNWNGSPDDLVGTHRVTGKNPDGSAYEGTVDIKVQPEGMSGGMRVSMEWKIGADVTRGTGLIQGRNLAVALADGVALYKVVGDWNKFISPDDGGLTLVGRWATSGADAVNEEIILVGKPAPAETTFPNVTALIGKFMTPQKVPVSITGDGPLKAITWPADGKAEPLTGLALGNGLAIRRAQGVSVFFVNSSLDAPYLMGQTLTGENTIEPENLFPPF